MIHYLAIAVAIIAFCNLANARLVDRAAETTRSDIVNVDLYYESLCGDSIRFVANQLVPAYENIGEYINVTYIPYGKATHEKIQGENGVEVWNFTCQHGAAECYGNKAQACAINEIITNPEISNEQQVLLDFVSCVMSASDPSVAVPECLETIGFDANKISVVNNCTESAEGDELLAGHGDKTHALEPTLTFVPTIVINEVFSQEDQDNSLVDFEGVIRKYISTDSAGPRSASSWNRLIGTAVFVTYFLQQLISN